MNWCHLPQAFRVGSLTRAFILSTGALITRSLSSDALDMFGPHANERRIHR